MFKFQTTNNVAIAGDWHGNTQYAVDVVNKLADFDVDYILHTGDFGFWADNDKFLQNVHAAAKQNNMLLLFVDGNHENHPLLNSFEIDENGFRPVTNHIWHIPRGHRFEINDKVILGLGGASSIDRKYRTEGVDWFADENITDQDVKTAVSGGKADIMITHEAPLTSTLYNRLSPNQNKIDSFDLMLSEQNQKMIEAVLDVVQPDVLYHGHHHFFYTDSYNGTKIVGLDCDGSEITQNVVVI